MASAIPIQNIYYLLCYAWNQLKEGELVDVGSVDSPELGDLFAKVLINGFHHLQRRGLEQAYQTHEEAIAGMRGRVNFASSARRMLLAHGKAQCEFDDLIVNTLPNQIIKATLRRLHDIPELDPSLKKQLYPLYRDLRDIDNIRLNTSTFRKVQLHSNNRFYRFLLNICELVLNAWLPDERAGTYRFRDFLRAEGQMRALFEAFLRNFYRQHLVDFTVSAAHIEWQASSLTDPELLLLPNMRTDITLRSPARTLIIDAKYYHDTLQTYYNKQTVRSGHLYQLLTYLQNAEATKKSARAIEGMLIYPVVGESLRQHYEILGHHVSVCTVDLAQPWPAIHAELINLLEH
jgi:5-methylcytosine-specific restriction enzyme subunit McrC